jgi:hypothetical protein
MESVVVPPLFSGGSISVKGDFLDGAHSVADAGFSRWLVPLAALRIHLSVSISIGQVYAFSVFNKPMSRLIGATAPACGDWSIPALGWIC